MSLVGEVSGENVVATKQGDETMSETSNHEEQVMDSNRRSFLASLMIGIVGFAGLTGQEAQAGPRGGRRSRRGSRGRGGNSGERGRGGQGGRGASGPSQKADQNLIHTLLSSRHQIRRQIKLLPNGIETLTETDNPQLRTILVQHVQSMKKRVEEVRPIRRRDPLFAALFRNAKKVSMMKVTPTQNGVHVIETSNDAFTVKLIQAHAKVVSLFIKNGQQEVRKNHPVPN